jgi:hypothetical protein
MKITGKDIAQLYIKEDTQKALDKATVLKEKKMSPFAQEFAQQMKQKGEGGVYRSKVTGYDVALKYATPKATPKTTAPKVAAPAAKSSAPKPATPSAPATMRPVPDRNIPGSQNRLPSDRFTPTPTSAKPEPDRFYGRMIPKGEMGLSSTSKPPAPQTPSRADPAPVAKPAKSDVSTAPSIGFSKGTGKPALSRPVSLPPSMTGMPTAKVDGKEVTQDYARSLTAPRGIRTFDKGNVDTSKFNYPGAASPEGRATKAPTQSTPETPPVEAPKPQAPSEPPKSDKPEVSSALKDRISPENLGSNPENLVNKDVIKGREPKPMNESVVNVGGNKYRIV